jgi:cell division protein FtsW (lipid II flippase)
VAIALELAWRAFGAFPGALRTARRVLLTLLALSTVSLVATGPRSYTTLWEWQPAVTTAALWLLTATALMVVWYQVPVSDWERAIMLGMSVYLLVFVALLGLLGRHGWAFGPLVSIVETLSYLALLAFWNRVAWRRDAAEEAAAPAVSPA